MLFHVREVVLNQLVQDNVCQGPAYLPLNRLWMVLPHRLHVMLCEFISVPCVSKIRVSPWWVWLSKCPRAPGSTESPTGNGGSLRVLGQGALPRVPSGACAPTAAAGGLTLGITAAKGAGLQSEGEMLWVIALRGCHSQGWFGGSSCITDSLPLLGSGRGWGEPRWSHHISADVQRGFYYTFLVTQSNSHLQSTALCQFIFW